jgi:flagellar biosynthetic protein FliO
MNPSVVLPGRPPRLRSRASALAFSLLLFTLAPGEALAAAPPAVATDTTPLSDAVKHGAGATATTAHSSGSGGAFVRMIVGLFIVLAVIYGIYWLLKTYGKSKKKSSAGEGGGGIDVVATTALGPNRSLHLVRVGSEFVLVGAAEQAVTQLRIYTSEETRLLEQQLDSTAAIRPLASRTTAGTPPLVRLMDELRKRTTR